MAGSRLSPDKGLQGGEGKDVRGALSDWGLPAGERLMRLSGVIGQIIQETPPKGLAHSSSPSF